MAPRIIASTSTEITTGPAPNPMARSVAISRTRLATALSSVFSAANNAARPMMMAIHRPMLLMIVRHDLLLIGVELPSR